MWFKRILPFALILGVGFAEKTINRDPAQESEKLIKNMFPAYGVVEHVIWDGNQISTVHGNHGDIVSYHITGESGLEWPKGSGKYAIFQSGIWLGSGKVRPAGSDLWQEELRTAAAEYTVEFVPGTIDEVTNQGHIYRIHRVELDAFLENDFATFSSMSAMLPQTVIEGSSVFTKLVETKFPTDDFANWPADAGAPWVDANGDGVYNIEDGDHPDILGDMFHWYVMNDGDAGTHTALWGTPPMNVEVQTSLFGFDQAGPLGNILFIRWVLINKGTDDLDSVFVSMWHDDDLGDANDDLVGCDTTLSVGYTYNDIDGDVRYGVEVPAVGADFFQGPLVDSPGDTASILTWGQGKGYYVRKVPDKKRLGLTSFVPYINSDPTLTDPNTAEEAYRYMNGLIGTSGLPFIDPITGETSVFVMSGDPTTGTGWLDDIPGDRRYLMTSGPFYFGVGDTIEVVGSIVIAAGSNWAKSITKMKYFDNFAQGAFDANFQVCSPPTPKVKVSQLDKKIVLSFEEGSEKVEGYTCSGYEFEGYNIYQGESATGPWHRIATYDVVDGVKLILDLTLDEKTGELLEVPAQFGTDSGIKHYIEITEDEVNNRSLVNYRKYYFAITTYAYDPDAAQRVIESPFQSIVAIPSPPGVGSEISYEYGQYLDVTHASGSSDAVVKPLVIDPYLLTGDSYEITFFEAGGTTVETISTSEGDSLAVDEQSIGTGQYSLVIEGIGKSLNKLNFDLNTTWFQDSTFVSDTMYVQVSGDTFLQVIQNDTLLDTVSAVGSFLVEYVDASGRTFSSSSPGGSANLTLRNYSPNSNLEADLTGKLFMPDGWDYVLLDVSLTRTDLEGSFTVTNLQYEGEPTQPYWRLKNVDSKEIKVMSNTDVESGNAVNIIDGFLLTVTNGSFAAILDTAIVTVDEDTSTSILFGGLEGDGIWADFLNKLPPQYAPSGEPAVTTLQNDLELRFTQEGSIGIFFKSNLSVIDTVRLPFEMWTTEGEPKQINVAVYQVGGSKPLFEKVSDTTDTYRLRMNVRFIPVYDDYNESAVLANAYHWGTDAGKMGWMLKLNKEKTVWENGNVLQIKFVNPLIPGSDLYKFVARGLITVDDQQKIKDQLDKINVFPNPYFGQNPEERNPQDRKIFFTHLGVGTTTIRIFTISGDMVKKIVKEIASENDPNNRAVWDLRNQNGIPVASGMYIAHITVENSNGKKLGERVLKLAIFQPEERLDLF
ncbi:MAG: hypothetical protein GXO92_03520 [FCB group bacterium]|nr:hypothetical protein [FCB group bacterium]